MRKKFWICLALLLVIPGLLFTVSCAKKTVKTETSVSEKPSGAEAKPPTGELATQVEQEKKQDQAELERQREMARQKALEEQRLRDEKRRQQEMEEKRIQERNAKQLAMIQRKIFLGELVLFDFDKSILTPVAQERLTRKAKFLKNSPNTKVIIEGHCDERGTYEYNLALGERRAEAAKAFLVDLGVSASRLTTISYGEERPFFKGSNETAWSMNRRAHFVIEAE
jgi:peptidoglycan-associated lipoprotein